MKLTNDHGLLVDNSTNPPTCAGYIFNFNGHGAFAPHGKVGDLTQAEIDTHNRLLAQAELEAIKKHGCGNLYLFTEPGNTPGKLCKTVGQWASNPGERIPVQSFSVSRHNMAGERMDVWFNFDGSRWHGVNIGDNDICRVKRLKA